MIAAFDGGGDLLQRRMRTVLVAGAVVLLPIVALNLWVTTVGFDRFDPDDTLFPSLGTGTRAGIEDLAPFLGASAASLAAAAVGYVVAVIASADRFDRSVPGLGSALGSTVRATPRVIVAWVLSHWWQPLLVLVVLSAESDDIAGLVFLFGIAAWFASSAMLFVVPAMVVERLGPFAAVRRSWQLFRRAAGAAFGFTALSTCLATLFLVGAATLPPLLEANGFLGFGDATWIAQGIVVQLCVLLVMPLIAACTFACYVEVRVDAEALDLELAAAEAFEGSSGGRDPVRDGSPR